MIVLENGSIVDGANSFIDVAYFRDYLDTYGVSLSSEKTDLEIEALLKQTFLFLESLDFCDSHEYEFDVNERLKKSQCIGVFFVDDGTININDSFEEKTLIERSIGQGAIVRKWQAPVFKRSGTNAMLQKAPLLMSYMKPLLCNSNQSELSR